jgi:hypothetical protein
MTREIAVGRLQARARGSYECGRLALAVRSALVVVPLTAICARETEAYTRCAIVGIVLFVTTVSVRWRQWRGIGAANAGLLTGVVPMAAALVLCRFAAGWPDAAAIAACTSAGLIAGALGGRSRMDASAVLIAGLTAALGCIGIGFGTAIGGAVGVTAGAAVAMRAATSS